MTDITAAMVKELRERTGAGMMDCKTALTENKGAMEDSVDWLRKKGLAKAAKKAGRTAADGLICVASEAKKAAVQRSRSVLSGMFAEQLAPYLPNFPFSPTEAKFIGAPIDFLVFKGMDAQSIEEVIFVEVKSGSARLNHNEHSLKDAIINTRVRWHEYHVPAPLTNSPDPATEPAL